MLSPELVANDRKIGIAGNLACCKSSSEESWRAKHGEEISRDLRGLNLLDVVGAGEIDDGAIGPQEGRKIVEASGTALPILIGRIRGPVAIKILFGNRFPEQTQVLGECVRSRLKHDSVDHAEDRGGDSDAKSQSQDACQSEARTVAQNTGCVA